MPILMKFKKSLLFIFTITVFSPVFSQSSTDLDSLIASRNVSDLVNFVENTESISFSPSHLGTRVFSDESHFRTRLATFRSAQTTPTGYVMHSLFAALSNGQDPQDQQSEAYFLLEALKQLKKRGQNLDPVIAGVTDAGSSQEFAVSGLVDTALMRNDQKLLSRVVSVLEALGFDQNYTFQSFNAFNPSEAQPISLPQIVKNALFESSVGDQAVENSAQLFEAASFLLNKVSNEALENLANDERATAEKAVDEIAAALRAQGHEMSPQERSLMIHRHLFLYDLPLRIAVQGGLITSKIEINLFDPAQGRSTAEETEHLIHVRIPAYLGALQRIFGTERIKGLMNAPIFPFMQSGDAGLLLYSPYAFAMKNSVPKPISDALAQLGGSPNERAVMFGQTFQVNISGQEQEIQYPLFGRSQANRIMELAFNGDVDVLRQMNLTSEEANSQSPTGFRATALHMALAGAGARFQQTLTPAQQRFVLSNSAAMTEFLKPVVETTRLLLERGADPDMVSGYFGPEGQIWYNVTEGTPIEVGDALAKALVADFDQARARLGRPKRNGIPQMAQPNSGVCLGIVRHLGRAGWLNN